MRNSLRFFALAWMVAVVPLGGITPAVADEFQVEEGFTRLDNGENLDGWNGRHEGWSVVDGAIHLTLREAKGHIYSDKPHSDACVIRLQYRATPRADSGIFVWGNQFQVRDYPTVGPNEYAAAAKPAGEWNDLEFDLSEGFAAVKLNGTLIEGKWAIGLQSKKGVGLQRERGDFDFRHIRIQEKDAEPGASP
jgi:hypothetical protein